MSKKKASKQPISRFYTRHVPRLERSFPSFAVLLHQAARGLRPFGVEAQRALRLEKGHFIVGQATDGLTDPLEANAMWAVNMRKPFFVGQRSLRILQQRGPRKVLIGIEFPDSTRIARECHLVIDGDGGIAGRITSVTRSSTLKKVIGLAMLMPERTEEIDGLKVRIDGRDLVPVRIVPIPFYDLASARQKAGVSA